MTARFERKMEELHFELIEMGKLCEQAISLSAKVILHSEEEIRKRIFEIEHEIDEKEREIQKICNSLLLLQHPVARDLRAVSTALHMIKDMERIGDQVVDIADLSKYIETHVGTRPEFVETMSKLTTWMVKESVEAFIKQDLILCKKVISDDDQVDEVFVKAKDQLACLIENSGLDVMSGLDLLMTAKYFERIGDHAVNVAEWVEYSITGKHKEGSSQKN